MSLNTRVTTKEYLYLAIPLIFTALTVPLLGFVDLIVIGRMNDASLIAGVSMGVLIFNTIYWLLGFLRVSTSGFTAIASGNLDESEKLKTLVRALLFALILGLTLLTIQVPLKNVLLKVLSLDHSIIHHVNTYYNIRIWAAPFVLINYCILGWLIGLSKAKITLILQVFVNLLNISLSLLFVLFLNMDVAGVALATMISEIGIALVGMSYIYIKYFSNNIKLFIAESKNYKPILNMLAMNRDLFIRTASLLVVYLVFARLGDKLGVNNLAANALLLQVQALIVVVYEGFANATSVFTGRAVAQNNIVLFRDVKRISFFSSALVVLIMVIGLSIFKFEIINQFTNIPTVIDIASQSYIWVILFPILTFWGNQLYGMFVGATFSSVIRNAMVISMVAFMVSVMVLFPLYNNNGLWISFVVFMVFRTITLQWSIPRLVSRINERQVN